jgi:hypothetical protein
LIADVSAASVHTDTLTEETETWAPVAKARAGEAVAPIARQTPTMAAATVA